MDPQLRILLIEDSETDAKLVLSALRRAGLAVDSERVQDAAALRVALERRPWDVVISDWQMPSFTAPEALAIVKKLRPDLPFIIASGTVGEEIAVEAMRAGADDFLLKGNLSRLAPAIERELREGKSAGAGAKAGAARWRSLTESGIAGIAIADRDGKVLEANAVYFRMLGHAVGDALPAWVHMTPPEWRHAVEAAGESLAAAGLALPWKQEVFRKDGSRIVVVAGAARIDAEQHILFVMDMTGHDQATQERYQTLSRYLFEAQERERRSLARELHDQLGQDLLAIQMNLVALQDAEGSPAWVTRAVEALRIVEHTMANVRTLAFELRPLVLDDLGLIAAVGRLVAEQARRTGYRGNFSAQPGDARLPPEIETASFRIVQEALANIARHARAGNVEVVLEMDEEALRFSVADDGVGFDVDTLRAPSPLRPDLGLAGMEERASLAGGKLEIQSAPGQGTTIRARFPLRRPARR